MTDHSMNLLLAHQRRRAGIVDAIAGRSTVAVVAAWAGTSAPLTGELARAIAGRSHRLYCRVLDGSAAPEERRGELSAVTVPMDEPILRSVLAGSRTILAIAASRCEEDAMTLLRGSNRDLLLRLRTALTEVGFAAMIAPSCPTDDHPAQLFNRSSGGGVELVLTRQLRRDLAKGVLRRPLFACYVDAVQRALAVDSPRREPRPWPRRNQVISLSPAPILSSAA